MKRIGSYLIYVLAVFIVLGRIGNALNDAHFIHGMLKLVPPTNGQAIGYNIESLVEDLIVAIAIFRVIRRKPIDPSSQIE